MSNPSESLTASFAAMNKKLNDQLDAMEKEVLNPTSQPQPKPKPNTSAVASNGKQPIKWGALSRLEAEFMNPAPQPQPKPKPNTSPMVVNGKQAITGIAQSKPRPSHAWSTIPSSNTSSASKSDPGLTKTINASTASFNATLSRLEAEFMKPTPPPPMPWYKPPTSFTPSSYTPSFTPSPYTPSFPTTTSFNPPFSSSFQPHTATNTNTTANSNSNLNSKQAKDANFASLQRELAVAQAELSKRIKERGAKELEGRKMELEATVMLVGATDKGKRFGNARVGYGHRSLDMVRAKEMLLEAKNVDVESAQLEVDRLLAAMRKCL